VVSARTIPAGAPKNVSCTGARSSLLAAALLGVAAFGCGGGSSGSGGGSVLPPTPPAALAIQNQSTLPKGLVGQSYSGKLQATGGVPPYTWSAQFGIAGLVFATDGTISGTPTQPGDFFPSFTVTDSKGATASAGSELDILAPLAFATPANLPDQNVGLPVGNGISAQGGAPPYKFTLAAGSSAPAGLTFTSSDFFLQIQGTPTSPGTYNFTVQVNDSSTPPLKASQQFTMNILNNLVLPRQALPDAVQNVPYVEQVQPAGGIPPYHFVLGQSLPPGLALDPATGKVSGTPTVPQSKSMPLTITDSAPQAATLNTFFSVVVQPPLSFVTLSLPDGALGFYNQVVNIAGGRQPYTARLTAGAMPDGLTIDSSSKTSIVVGGNTTKNGLFKFTLQVSDSYESPNTATHDFQIRVSDPLVASGPQDAQILYNQSFSASFQATGGFPPYTWTIDNIPPGFAFNPATATISGTPSSAVFTPSNITAHDSSSPPLTSSVFFGLQVWSQVTILTTSLPAIATGRAAWLQPRATGGFPSYQWNISSGSLPPGMTLGNTDGTISGAPTAAGSYPFTLSVTDGNNIPLQQTASRPFTLTVKDSGQMTRNDTIAQATPLSNITLFASISPFSDASTPGPDFDVYAVSATPGSVVQVFAAANSDFLQSVTLNYGLLPVIELVDTSGKRYQTCSAPETTGFLFFNQPCANGLDGTFDHGTFYSFQVPGTGSVPVTFYVRVSDARGDARPDLTYTFSVSGVN
jgi:large repetitive protein